MCCFKIFLTSVDISLFSHYNTIKLVHWATETNPALGNRRSIAGTMKKLISAILVLALASFAIFADTDFFEVETKVEGVNMMKITAEEYNSTTPTPEGFEGVDAFEGPLVINAAGDQQSFTAYLSTLSNNRTGYTVSMTATAMKSSITSQADAYINYTVTVQGGGSITTNNTTSSPTSVDVITVLSLTELAVQSRKISLTVDTTSYNSAVEGSYSGTVTFTYTAT